MTTLPCPHNDGGQCRVPDLAVLVVDGEFSLIRAKALSRLYPGIESPTLREVRLEEPINYNELVRNVAITLAPEAAIAGSGEFEDYESRSAAFSMLEAVATAVGPNNGALVNCSCGHVFET